MSDKKHSSSSSEGDYFDSLVEQEKCKLIQNNHNFTPRTPSNPSKIPQQYSSMSSPFLKKSGNGAKVENMLKREVVDKIEAATFDCNESVQLLDYDDNSDYNNDQYSLIIDLVTPDEKAADKTSNVEQDHIATTSQQSNSETVSKSSVTQQSLSLNQDVDALIKCAQNQDEKVTQIIADLMNISEVNAKLAAHLGRSSRDDF